MTTNKESIAKNIVDARKELPDVNTYKFNSYVVVLCIDNEFVKFAFNKLPVRTKIIWHYVGEQPVLL